MFEKWHHVNLMKCHKAECKVLHLDWSNPTHKNRLDKEWIESSSEEEDLRVLIDGKLSMSHQYALEAQEANNILGCIKVSMTSRTYCRIIYLYSALMKPHLDAVFDSGA